MERRQNECFKRNRAFFAFSNSQLEDGLNGDNKSDYVNMGYGLICHKDTANTIVDELEQIRKDAIAEDISDNTIEGCIRRELYNHEAFWTGEIDTALGALDGYNVSEKQVIEIYRAEYPIATQED
jgi:hypothetical protein